MKTIQEERFSNMVSKLVKSGATIQSELTSIDCNLLHAVLGISGEAGEILDAVKKAVIYRKRLDLENLVEELGDIEFYLEQLRQIIDVSREQILKYNMLKLSNRYSSDYLYTDKAAQERADKK